MPEEEQKPIGKVTHYFDRIGVAVVKFDEPVKTGDKIRVEGRGRSFEQTIESMQIEKEKIQEAKAGQEVGLKVSQPVKEGYKVFRA